MREKERIIDRKFSQTNRTASSTKKESPEYLQPYAGMIENNPNLTYAVKAIEEFSKKQKLSEDIKQNLLYGYIWREDPKNITHIASINNSDIQSVQKGIYEILEALHLPFTQVDRIILHNEQKDILTNLTPWTLSHINQVQLRPRIKEAVVKSLQAMNNEEIATQMKVTKGQVLDSLSTGRKIIGQELLLPKGIKKLGEFELGNRNKSSYVNAATEGRMLAGKVLNMWYSTENAINIYENKRPKLDTKLLTEGKIIASSVLTDAQINMIRRNFPKFIIRRQGRVYIAEKNVNLFKSWLQELENERERLRLEGYIPIPKLTQDSEALRNRRRIADGARNGKFPAVKSMDGRWYGKAEEMEVFNKSKKIYKPRTTPQS